MSADLSYFACRVLTEAIGFCCRCQFHHIFVLSSFQAVDVSESDWRSSWISFRCLEKFSGKSGAECSMSYRIITFFFGRGSSVSIYPSPDYPAHFTFNYLKLPDEWKVRASSLYWGPPVTQLFKNWFLIHAALGPGGIDLSLTIRREKFSDPVHWSEDHYSSWLMWESMAERKFHHLSRHLSISITRVPIGSEEVGVERVRCKLDSLDRSAG